MRVAARMDPIGTETAFEAAARARALEGTGRSNIHLEIGEPDFDTPANRRVAGKRALDAGFTHYLSGTSFGDVGRNHIRISYANSRENLAEALRRIRGVVEPVVAARG